MIDLIEVALAVAAGALLGAAYFAGLWWTVRRAFASPAPARWLVASFGVRAVLLVTAFYVIAGAEPVRLVACLGGFVGARLAATRWTRGALRDLQCG